MKPDIIACRTMNCKKPEIKPTYLFYHDTLILISMFESRDHCRIDSDSLTPVIDFLIAIKT